MKIHISRIALGMMSAFILLFCLTGCRQTTTIRTNEITLGVAWPFASDTSFFEKGIDMAMEEINRKGGVDGRNIALRKMDDGSLAAEGLAVAQSLSEDKSVMAVIGHKSSYISIPSSAIYEDAGLVMLSPASTAPKLTEKGSKYIFRVIPDDEVLAQKVTEYLADKNRRRLVVYYSDDSYGKGLADAIEDKAVQYGITVVDRFSYYSGIDELNRLKRRWRAFDYDGIFVAASLSEASRFLYDARLTGISTLFAGGNILDSPMLSDLVGDKDMDIIIGSVFDPNSSEKARTFTEDFEKKYNHSPDIYAALAYDAVYIMVSAINSSETLSRKEIADELRNLGQWAGVCGIHEFSENGDDIGDLAVIKKLSDGEFIRLIR